MGRPTEGYYLRNGDPVAGGSSAGKLAGINSQGLKYWAFKQGKIVARAEIKRMLESVDRNDPLEVCAFVDERLTNLLAGVDPTRRKINDESDKAIDIGSTVHNMIEAYLLRFREEPWMTDTEDDEYHRAIAISGMIIPTSIQGAVKTAMMSFIKWWFHTVYARVDTVKIHDIEAEYVSETLRCGATIDAVIEIAKRLILFDWKTATGIYPDSIAQVAIYATIRNEFNPYKITDLAVGRFDKFNGTTDVKMVSFTDAIEDLARKLCIAYDAIMNTKLL